VDSSGRLSISARFPSILDNDSSSVRQVPNAVCACLEPQVGGAGLQFPCSGTIRGDDNGGCGSEYPILDLTAGGSNRGFVAGPVSGAQNATARASTEPTITVSGVSPGVATARADIRVEDQATDTCELFGFEQCRERSSGAFCVTNELLSCTDQVTLRVYFAQE
jgi:hypothetical protein